MASIFKNSLIKERLDKIKIPDFENKIYIIKRWHDDYHNGTLKEDKETSREQAYNQDVFVKILGYREKPEKPYSIEPKATTNSGQLPDAIIGTFEEDNINLSAVIELKGASIPLDKPQRREGNMSPIQQAFKYKIQYPKCPFVIASNFYEFRLFQDNQLDYEVWTLDDLVDESDNYYNLRKFYYLLNKDNFTSDKGNSVTQNLLTDIRIEQEDITKKFYKEYRELRLELLRNIYQKNKSVRDNIELGIEKAQKIIDRVVFVCFCEDSGLLPDNSLARVLKYSENSFGSLWNTLKGFFEGIDKGSEKLEIPEGYNGGLFKNDEDLNNLHIDDEVLKKLATISKYNFSEDLSVTILGHIFEQSISDLEEIKRKVNDDNNIDNISVSKRKKDGIFYTPDYIVDYIVQNSLGKYFSEKEEELKIKHKLKEDILDKNYEKREQLAYQEYQVFIEGVKVLDPACGSGAFLVKVFDYLLEENKRVGQILGGGLFNDEQLYKDILKKNIFGVDLNSESVEISRLSLWLKTAQKNKKLTSLDENIKCGNSLVNNPEFAGSKAFDWNKEFSKIMEEGGFDVIVGNPPYIKEATNKDAFKGLHDKSCYQGKMDLWYLFGSLGIDLLKKEGLLSFIAPSNWITNDGASKFRNKILETSKIVKFVDFGDYKVFNDAGIQTMIFVLEKNADNTKYAVDFQRIKHKKNSLEEIAQFLDKIPDEKFEYFKVLLDKNLLLDKTISFSNLETNQLLEQISKQSNFSLDKEDIASGIDTMQEFVNQKSKEILGQGFEVGDGIFVINDKELQALNLSKDELSLVKPFYTTSELGRYFSDSKNHLWVIYTDSSFKDAEKMGNYPNLKSHLDKYQKVITSANKPYGLHRAREERLFKGEKIFSLRKAKNPTFTYTNFDSYINRTFIVVKTERINNKYLTALLNSRVVEFWLKNKGKRQGDIYQIDMEPLLNLPLVDADMVHQKKIVDLVSFILEQNQKRLDYQKLIDEVSDDFDREIKLKKILEESTLEIQKADDKIQDIIFEIYKIEPANKSLILNSI